ncbi:hypothetical protein L1887_30647 [Cichorium endivia]|nr:hypothetical protein L1887_30647 [Cichorium endivia]
MTNVSVAHEAIKDKKSHFVLEERMDIARISDHIVDGKNVEDSTLVLILTKSYFCEYSLECNMSLLVDPTPSLCVQNEEGEQPEYHRGEGCMENSVEERGSESEILNVDNSTQGNLMG